MSLPLNMTQTQTTKSHVQCYRVWFEYSQGAVTLWISLPSLNSLSITTASTNWVQKNVFKSLAEDWVRKLSTPSWLSIKAQHCTPLAFMKHAGGVYTEKMVIALMIILLTTNFYPLSRRLPAPAFVDNSFYLLLPRNMFSLSNNCLDLYSFSLHQRTKYLCVCVFAWGEPPDFGVSGLSAPLCTFRCTAQLF